MVGWVERPPRPGQSARGWQKRRNWVVPACAAVGLHLSVLVAIVFIPGRPAPPDEAPPAEVVTLLLEQPATDASANTSRPDDASDLPVTPNPLAMPLPEPLPPEQPPLPMQSAESQPPHPEEAPPQPAQPETPTPTPRASPEEAQPKKLPSGQRPSPPSIEKPASRPPMARIRPAQAPPVAGPPAGPAKPAVPADATRAAANVLDTYEHRLAEHVKTYQRYPALARSRREEGLVVVHVTIRRDGQIAAMSVERGSGSDRLDSEALATLKRADPLPAMPAAISGETIELTFPLRFHLE